MRIPRSIQLHSSSGLIHQFWRCHNKEYYLTSPHMKTLYLRSLQDALKTHNKENTLKIHAYTCMNNHFHNLMKYTDGSTKLSNYFRKAHSLFGARYNRIHNRSGKVAEGRPKTSVIENTEHEMRVHFYIEANPIRSGKCTEKKLRNYCHSSYRFYAFGVTDSFTKMLTVPDWYLKLGSTPKVRQRKYRVLFCQYIGKELDRVEFFSPFIGSPLWKLQETAFVKKLIQLAPTKKDLTG